MARNTKQIPCSVCGMIEENYMPMSVRCWTCGMKEYEHLDTSIKAEKIQEEHGVVLTRNKYGWITGWIHPDWEKESDWTASQWESLGEYTKEELALAEQSTHRPQFFQFTERDKKTRNVIDTQIVSSYQEAIEGIVKKYEQALKEGTVEIKATIPR